MKNYMYNVLTASIECGVTCHPQEQMAHLGFAVVKSEPVPIADCWWFRTANCIEPLPDYITKLSDNFRFSDEFIAETKRTPKLPPMTRPDGNLTDYGKYLLGLDYKHSNNMKG